MVSIARVVQKNAVADSAELVVVTDRVKEKHMKEASGEAGEKWRVFTRSAGVIREY